MPSYQIGSVNYHYKLIGSANKPAVVLISGLWADQHYWDPAIPLLDQFQILTFDNRGIGKTTDANPNADFTLQDMAAHSILLINHIFKDKPVILIGQSMGAAIAQCIAEQAPQMISQLILCNGPENGWAAATLWALESMMDGFKNNIPFDHLFKILISWCYGQQFLTDNKKITLLKQAMLTMPAIQSLQDQQRQLNAVKSFHGINYQHLTMPIKIIYGEEDLLSPPSVSKNLHKQLANSELIAFPGAHGLILEALPEFIQIMSTLSKS